MKTATCNADMIKLQDNRVLLSPRYCLSTDCQAFPCSHIKKWAKFHGVLDVVKGISKAGA